LGCDDRKGGCIQSETNETIDWKTYTNTQYGFKLTFPDSWKGYSVVQQGNEFDFLVPLEQPYTGQLGQAFVVKTIPVGQWKDGTPNGLASPLGVYVGKNNKYAIGFSESIQDSAGFPRAVVIDAHTNGKINSFFTILP